MINYYLFWEGNNANTISFILGKLPLFLRIIYFDINYLSSYSYNTNKDKVSIVNGLNPGVISLIKVRSSG